MDSTNYQTWLTGELIPPLHDGMLSIQLCGLIEAHKPRNRQHNGCRCYGFHLQSVGAENVSFNLHEVAKKCGKWFSGFGTESWKEVFSAF
jgi:hypothetical protein